MMLQLWKPIEHQDRALGNGFSTSSIGQISFSPETMVDVADETHNLGPYNGGLSC